MEINREIYWNKKIWFCNMSRNILAVKSNFDRRKKVMHMNSLLRINSFSIYEFPGDVLILWNPEY